jgi:hypothetical protein
MQELPTFIVNRHCVIFAASRESSAKLGIKYVHEKFQQTRYR